MHIEKYKRGNVSGVIQHDERSIENHTNEKIDVERSHLNYNLAEGNPTDNYNKRMSEVFCINRKNINTLASICVTAPSKLHTEDQERFFQEVYEFYSNKFGKENVVSAFVHLDETTPHIHFKFIPVYEQTKTTRKGEVYTRQVVSFDEVCSRKFYQKAHQELQKHMDKTFGYHLDIINGKTKGVPTVKALKELDKLNKAIEVVQEELDMLLGREVAPQVLLEKMDPIEIGTFSKKNYVKYEDYEKLFEKSKSLLGDIELLTNQKNVLEAQNKVLQRDLDKIKATDLFQENKALKTKLEGANEMLAKDRVVMKDQESLISNLTAFKSLVVSCFEKIEQTFNIDLDPFRELLGIPTKKELKIERLMEEYKSLPSTLDIDNIKERMEVSKRKSEIKNELNALGRDVEELEQEIEYHVMR